jgi:hypothetical protein
VVGITLSPERIRAAPPEVRRWLEHEVAFALGLHAPELMEAQRTSPRLVALDVAQAAQVLALIEGRLPVVNVFFELGREGGSAGVRGVEVFRLGDILRHARLQSPEQLVACLDMINEAVRRVSGDMDATLYGLDDRGYCFVAEQTQRSIQQVWRQIVGEPAVSLAGAWPPERVGPLSSGGLTGTETGPSSVPIA